MATYYVRKTGNNGNAGTSAGAAWLTVTKAVQTATSGDTVYVGAGVYRETLTVTTTPASTVTMIADVDGANTGDVGEVRITSYTTNDKSASSGSTLLDLNSKDYFSWRNFVFQSGSTSCVATSNGACVNTQFIDCTFISLNLSSRCINMVSNVQDTAPNWLFDRCRFIFNGNATDCIYMDVVQSSGPDLDTGIVIRNCLIINLGSGNGIHFNPSSSGGSGIPFNTGNVQVYNNTILGGSVGIRTGANASTSQTMKAYNNFISSYSVGIQANTSGQILEDYNFIYSPTLLSNVSTGSNSQSASYAPLLHIGQELQQGRLVRPLFLPTEDSPILGYGNNATYTSSVDILNRNRPSGGGPTWASSGKAVGAYEHHDFASKETSIVEGTTASIKWKGPGDQQLYIPVNPSQTTISVKAYYDSSYGGGTKPTLRLLANGEIGVSTQSVTTTGAVNTFNTLQLSNFTPSSRGWVIIALESYASGSGTVYWDTVSVS